MTLMDPTPIDRRPVLLIEDNPDDQLLTQIAFEKGHVANELIAVGTGELGLDYLFRRGVYADRPADKAPAVVLLDVNLPGINGFQVLETVRAHPVARVQPIIMLTSSDRDDDIMRAYGSGVNAYMRKPVDVDAFVKAIVQMNLFWFVVNRNPTY